MHAIGIDIGGTKIAGAVVDELGAIVREDRVPTDASRPEEIENAVVAMIERLADGPEEIAGAGVAAAGFIGPPGRASGSTTDTTPGTAARSRRIGGIAAATAAEVGSTPVSTSVSDSPLWSIRPSRSSAALLCDPGTSGAPDVTLSNTDWPPWIPSPATP